MELEDLIRSIKTSRSIPTEEDLRSLPHGKAFIYGRVSTQGQVKDSRESIHEVAKLVILAKKDGLIPSRTVRMYLEPWKIAILLSIVVTWGYPAHWEKTSDRGLTHY